jgi:hypothetical protein
MGLAFLFLKKKKIVRLLARYPLYSRSSLVGASGMSRGTGVLKGMVYENDAHGSDNNADTNRLDDVN